MGLVIGRYDEKNHNRFGSPSATSCDGIEEKPRQPVEYACGNQAVLEIGFLRSVRKYW